MDAETASNGLAAQKQLSESHFDVMVLDVKMPGMDGTGLLRMDARQRSVVPDDHDIRLR